MSEFVLPEKRAVLVLDDGDYAGAEISVRLRISVAVARAVALALDAKDFDELGRIFLAEGLVSWTLADHKGPLPQDAEGWDRLTALEQVTIPTTWLQAAVNPAGPLPQPSSDTEPSPEASAKSPPKPRSKSPRNSSGRKSSTAS